MSVMHDLPYRPCVGIMLLNDQGMVFVGSRLDIPDAWQMPQGGIDEGESVHEAARRELREEIGTDKVEFLAETADWLRYDFPEHTIGRAYGGRYRGQAQKWIAGRFIGKDSDIDLGASHPEFASWRWCPANALLGIIVPFKRQVYEAVLQEFQPVIAQLVKT